MCVIYIVTCVFTSKLHREKSVIYQKKISIHQKKSFLTVQDSRGCVLLRTIYNACFCFLLDESWSLPDSLPEPGSDLSWWDSDIFADQSILTETPREVDNRIEWWDQSLFDEPDQEEATEPNQDQTAMTDQDLAAKANQDEPTEPAQIPGTM